jgi:DNA-binding winged helix-turn-helix (wHTH) protein/Tol biopolymer transport system component
LSSPEVHPGERRRYSFGSFTVDVDRRVLLRGGDEVPLRSKSFEVLAYLVDHHSELVTKAALMQAVWPDTAVTDNSLAQCMVEIRRALDDESQQLIRTVARRGYLFAAPVTTPAVAFPPPQPAVAPAEPRPFPVPPPRVLEVSRRYVAGAVILVLTALVAGGLMLFRETPTAQRELTYTQLTNFTDSVVTPALSPDGRMLAFIRGDTWWLSRGSIYVKLLPNGEPVQITNDRRLKYGLSFSPDGSRIAYTVAPGWDTYTVSPFAGEPKLMLKNAAGLTWLDERRILFAEIRTGVHMGVVTATESRSEHRSIYFPQDVRRMVHLSYASPDRKWALAVEMDPVWQPCRVIPMDGSSAGWQVGPSGKCTSAAWSPDGKWMYLGVEVDGGHHLWRQRFPKGEPEQITSGPTEEEGVAVAPDGRSLITSIGMRQSAVWIRDANGERAITSEGYVPPIIQAGLFGALPRFSRDGKSLFYLGRLSPQAAIELWKIDLESGRSQNVAPGLSMLEYDVSDDGKEVVFSTQPAGKSSQLWLATLDRSSPPQLISSSGETSPHFGPDGQILYRLSDEKTHYLARMKRDGSERSHVAAYPIGNVQTISSDRRWVLAITPKPNAVGGVSMALPIDGRPPRRICVAVCRVAWAPDGKFLYVAPYDTDKTVAIPIPPGEMFPNLPSSGIRGFEDAAAFPGSRVIEGYDIAPGPDPSVVAFVKTTVHRNLFRIPLEK